MCLLHAANNRKGTIKPLIGVNNRNLYYVLTVETKAWAISTHWKVNSVFGQVAVTAINIVGAMLGSVVNVPSKVTRKDPFSPVNALVQKGKESDPISG